MSVFGGQIDVSTALVTKHEQGICAIYSEINVKNENEIRFRKLFKGAEAHDIPLAKEALVLHTNRVHYHCFMWKHCLLGQFAVPSPHGHGWCVDNEKIDICLDD